MTTEVSKCDIDPAAVFACALSLWEVCTKRADEDPELNLSDAYSGIDQLMREVMRIAEMFEGWACAHVVFELLSDVWPYFLDDKFGDACLAFMEPDGLAGFDEDDCLRIAYQLRLPIRADGSLCLPVDVRATNPVFDSAFKEFRIQTVRDELADNTVVPFTEDGDPFDEELGAPYFGLYGVGDDGLLEHIADRTTYAEARSLARKLAPGIGFPEVPVCFGSWKATERDAPGTACGGTPQPRGSGGIPVDSNQPSG
jgi:hypothetical protein